MNHLEISGASSNGSLPENIRIEKILVTIRHRLDTLYEMLDTWEWTEEERRILQSRKNVDVGLLNYYLADLW